MPEPMRLPAAFSVVTPAGRSLLLVAAAAYLLDAVGGWGAFALVWVAALVMGAVALVVAVLPLRTTVALAVTPPRVVAGGRSEVVLTARTRSAVPVPAPVVEVPVGEGLRVVRLPMLRRGRTVQERLELTGLRRGVIAVGPVRGRRGDPLGLVRWRERWSSTAELLVLPRMVPVDSLGAGAVRDQEGTPSDEVSMSDLAFHALREYVPGDDLRHVHWRSSAKADTLLVRQYHDTRRSMLSVVIDIDTASYADPEDFELAVSTAASIATRASRDGLDLALFAADHAVTGRGLDALLDVCCRVQPGRADPVADTREAVRLAPDTSWLVLCTGGADTERLVGAARAQLAAEVQLLVVRADTGSPTAVSVQGSTRVLRLGDLDELPRAVAAVSSAVAG